MEVAADVVVMTMIDLDATSTIRTSPEAMVKTIHLLSLKEVDALIAAAEWDVAWTVQVVVVEEAEEEISSMAPPREAETTLPLPLLDTNSSATKTTSMLTTSDHRDAVVLMTVATVVAMVVEPAV